MSETLPGYDARKLASPPEEVPVGKCEFCDEDAYDGDVVRLIGLNSSWIVCSECARRSLAEWAQRTGLDEWDQRQEQGFIDSDCLTYCCHRIQCNCAS